MKFKKEIAKIITKDGIINMKGWEYVLSIGDLSIILFIHHSYSNSSRWTATDRLTGRAISFNNLDRKLAVENAEAIIKGVGLEAYKAAIAKHEQINS